MIQHLPEFRKVGALTYNQALTEWKLQRVPGEKLNISWRELLYFLWVMLVFPRNCGQKNELGPIRTGAPKGCKGICEPWATGGKNCSNCICMQRMLHC